MNKFIATIVALTFCALAAGCNTIEGAGKDIKRAGEKIEEAASRKDKK